MRHCDSCGGVIGQDCFNPAECAYITAQIEHNKQHELEQRIAYLESQLNKGA